MKILCVCDQGNNRSVHIAHLLKYQGHDTIAVGANTATQPTREMLTKWADLIIFTDKDQLFAFPDKGEYVIWPIPDVYPRPFNKQLNKIVRLYVAQLPDSP